jgi:hypothetical protein
MHGTNHPLAALFCGHSGCRALLPALLLALLP